MKYALRILTLITATLLFSGTMAGQRANFSTNDGLTLGFGLGGSYQSSDIANSLGAGFDFTFGSHLYKRDDAFLAVDWKFRFLAGENIAYDHRENLDGTFSNNKFSFFNYDLEIGLTLNRLRERTRIVVTGFAGPGITHGRSYSDLLDAGGSPYDFTAIDPGKTRSEVKADLIALSDGEFETQVVNKAALLPTAGIYIGYQFSRSFSMGIEHKTNFSLSEKNGAFGIDMDNKIISGSKMDKIHYTTLGFKWILGGGGGYSRGGAPYETTYTPPYSGRTVIKEPPVTQERPVVRVNPPSQPPVTKQTITNPPVTKPPVTASPLPGIRFINPSTPVSVDRSAFPLRVQTTNVQTWDDVTVYVNGSVISNFSLSREGLLTTNIGLREGENKIEVTGRNNAGSKSESTSITYRRAVTTTQTVTTTTPPVTTVTTPPVTTVTTPPVTTVTTPPVTTVTTPPVTTVTPPVTTVTTPPVTTVTPPVTTVTTPPVTTVTPPVTTVTTPPVTVVEDKACGPRINPGNSAWQFCLVTPSGTYNRDNLTNSNFSYSGAASSLFFMPIAGGGDVIVNGKPYPIRSGQYYLFTGSLTVSVSTKNPGSMGQWSVCITADRAPLSGNGNNRPQSPCETGEKR